MINILFLDFFQSGLEWKYHTTHLKKTGVSKILSFQFKYLLYQSQLLGAFRQSSENIDVFRALPESSEKLRLSTAGSLLSFSSELHHLLTTDFKKGIQVAEILMRKLYV